MMLRPKFLSYLAVAVLLTLSPRVQQAVAAEASPGTDMVSATLEHDQQFSLTARYDHIFPSGLRLAASSETLFGSGKEAQGEILEGWAGGDLDLVFVNLYAMAGAGVDIRSQPLAGSFGMYDLTAGLQSYVGKVGLDLHYRFRSAFDVNSNLLQTHRVELTAGYELFPQTYVSVGAYHDFHVLNLSQEDFSSNNGMVVSLTRSI